MSGLLLLGALSLSLDPSRVHEADLLLHSPNLGYGFEVCSQQIRETQISSHEFYARSATADWADFCITAT